MINNSSYFLNNYKLERHEIGFCFMTGLTGAPYAKRHWEFSKINSTHSVWHKAIAVVEYIPFIGGLAALIERIIVVVHSLLRGNSEKVTETFPSISIGNATASEFIDCINPTLFAALQQLSQEEVQEFLDRGGCLNIITQKKIDSSLISINKNEQIMTGCNSGINRSQVAAAVFKNMQMNVHGVLAGGDSPMNPEADYPSLADPLKTGEDEFLAATNFQKIFNIPKFAQFVTEIEFKLDNPQSIKNAKQAYQNFINGLSQMHFITFGPCAVSVMRRLLQREGRLEGFTITHCPWTDEIAHPPEGIQRYSQQSYKRFAEKLQACFHIT